MHILKKSIVYILSKIYYKLIKEFFVNLDKLILSIKQKFQLTSSSFVRFLHTSDAQMFFCKNIQKRKKTHTHTYKA